MSIILPTIEDLEAAQSQAHRALWLKMCPDMLCAGYHSDIRAALEASGFAPGIAYLNARVSTLAAVRLESGLLPPLRLLPLETSRIDMDIAVRRGRI